jgi:hypothetical protein
LLRILRVTAIVAILGGLAGALASALVIGGMILFIIPHSAEIGTLVEVFLTGTLIGFVVGGILSPIAAWLFLRRVPLWRASTETAFAAVFAFTLSIILGNGSNFALSVGLGLVCALLAALRLQRAFRHHEPVAMATGPNEDL